MSEMNNVTVDRQENGLTYYSIPAPQPAKDHDITLPDPLADLDKSEQKPVAKELETQTSDAEDGGVYTRGVLAGVRKKRGKTDATLSSNAIVIMENSKHFQGVRYNELSLSPAVYPVTDDNGNEIPGTRLPWDDENVTLPRAIRDDDIDSLSLWIENITHVHFNKDALGTAIIGLAKMQKVNPLTAYFDSLPAWDGKPRLDDFLINYMGATAQPKEYVELVTRLTICAAVKRAYSPGEKFDQCLIISGAQGIGKTSVWFYLTQDIDGGGANKHPYVYADFTADAITEKDELMKTCGKLIVEMDEFDQETTRKVSARKIKSFITQSSDTYRAPYGRSTISHYRTWVFVGSSNTSEYLRDTTGNRRYFPVISTCEENNNTHGPWLLTHDEISQIWAEAKYYAIDKKISLDINTHGEKIKSEWMAELDDAYDADPKTGFVEQYLDMYIPTAWYNMTADEHHEYINNYGTSTYPGMVKKRDKICLLEIAELIGYTVASGRVTRQVTSEIERIMAGIPGWKMGTSRANFGKYGYSRKYWTHEN